MVGRGMVNIFDAGGCLFLQAYFERKPGKDFKINLSA